MISMFALLIVWASLVVTGSAPSRAEGEGSPGFIEGLPLTGKYLVASPDLRDPNFVQTVIFMVRHDAEGAMGIVVNRAIGTVPLVEVLSFLGITTESELGSVQILYGGPVEPEAAFVLHSTDYLQDGSLHVNEDVALTSKQEIFEAIAKGEGPEQRLLAFGFSGWGPGQLEKEFGQGSWFIIPGDVDFLFDDDIKSKWQRAHDQQEINL